VGISRRCCTWSPMPRTDLTKRHTLLKRVPYRSGLAGTVRGRMPANLQTASLHPADCPGSD